jgi:unsaturated pyranuronate lyase
MAEACEFFDLNNRTQGQHRDLAPGLSTQIFVGDNSMLSLVTFEPNGAGQIHSHQEEQWGMLLEGDGIRTQAGDEHPVETGDFWRTPGGVPHGFRAGSDGARVLDIFSPPPAAYRKLGTGFAHEQCCDTSARSASSD